MLKSLICRFACLVAVATAFTVPTATTNLGRVARPSSSAPRYMNGAEEPEGAATVDPMEEAMEEMDEETRRQMEKARRADELRAS